MFYQAFVGLLLRERFLEGNDTHEIKPILAVSRNASVGTNRAEPCAGSGGRGRRRRTSPAWKEGRHWGGSQLSRDRRDGAGTGHRRDREEPRAGRGAKGPQHCQHHSRNLQERCSMGCLSTEGQREKLLSPV